MQQLLLWKSIILWVCVCSITYPACNAPYCHLWPVRLYNIFPHYLMKTWFSKEKKLLNKISGFLFCPQTFPKFSKKKWATFDPKCILVFTSSARYSCLILKKLEFFSCRFSINNQMSNFQVNSLGASRGVPYGQTDRPDAANNRFPQLCKCV